jgi:hypothetical protein
VHSAGQLETKADVIKAITSGKTVVERMDYSESSVRFYGKTAVVRWPRRSLPQLDQYRAHERAARLGQRSARLADGGAAGDPAGELSRVGRGHAPMAGEIRCTLAMLGAESQLPGVHSSAIA